MQIDMFAEDKVNAIKSSLDWSRLLAQAKVSGVWLDLLRSELAKPYAQNLLTFLQREYEAFQVCPPPHQWFAALERTSFEGTRVVLIAQDPYPKEGQAHGLAFSVQGRQPLPASLRNIFKEAEADLEKSFAGRSGDLTHWADQGVLLLNVALTVREGAIGSHRDKGWEHLTDAMLSRLNLRPEPVIFMILGKDAQTKLPLITAPHHHVIVAPHPSPLAAYKGFFGSKIFSRVNGLLASLGHAPIDW